MEEVHADHVVLSLHRDTESWREVRVLGNEAPEGLAVHGRQQLFEAGALVALGLGSLQVFNISKVSQTMSDYVRLEAFSSEPRS